MATNDKRDQQIYDLAQAAKGMEAQLRYLESEAAGARDRGADHDRRLVKIETKVEDKVEHLEN
jgi:hypothetical protein